MGQENKAKTTVPQELSQPEATLSELNERIWEANRYLMSTFFRDDTWNVRQGAVYGFPILKVIKAGKDHCWEEEQIVGSILADLGDRLGYYEAAYHFPDVLSALGQMTKTSWVEMLSEGDPNKPKSKIAKEILEEIQRELEEETGNFERFLTSANLGNAFTVRVDKETGEYQISDLPLDANELRGKWQKWFGANANGVKRSIDLS